MNSTLSNTKPQSSTNAQQAASDTKSYRRPAYQIQKENDTYEVEVQVPGVRKEDISIHLEKDTLTIQATRNDGTNDDWKTLHREISQRDFQLKLNVRFPVDAEKISAITEDGMLVITLPTAEAAKPRTVTVD